MESCIDRPICTLDARTAGGSASAEATLGQSFRARVGSRPAPSCPPSGTPFPRVDSLETRAYVAPGMPAAVVSPVTARLDLLDPAEVARLGGLEVVTEGIVEGFLAGLHRSPRRGFFVEFAEHRMYQPGDEPRYLDWRLLARSDRLYVKQFEEETNLRAMLVLDTSRSMDWSGAPGARLTKRAYAECLAAALALVLLRQRDATGLLTFDEEVRRFVPPRARHSQWHLLLHELQATPRGGGTAAAPALRRVVEQLRRRGLVVFISDLLFDPPLTLTALRFLRHRGHQVLVLHLMDPEEVELRGPAEARYEDPESGEAVVLRPADWAEAYARTVRTAVAEWRAACRRRGIAYERVTTDTPFGLALRQALVRSTGLA